MLPILFVPEWLGARPVLHRKMRIRCEKFRRLSLGLVQPSELRQARRQNPLRPHPVSCLVSKGFDGILVSTCHVLSKSKKPIVPSGRMRVETKCLPQIGDTLRGASLERLELSQEGPSVRMIGIQAKRRRQLRSTLIGPAVKDQHIPKNCMSDGIFSVERDGPLGCSEGGNQVMFLSFPP